MKAKEIIEIQRNFRKFSPVIEVDSYNEGAKLALEVKDEKTIYVKKFCPLLHEGFPITFNLSFIEIASAKIAKLCGLEMEKEIYDYTKIPPNSFSYITKVIRHQDISELLEGSRHHALLFHIADIFSGTTTNRNEEEVLKKYGESTEEFFRKLNVNIDELVFTKFPGGVIERDEVKKHFPPDVFSKFNPKFRYVETLENTFLSIKIFNSPTNWGYRNEILHAPTSLDVATIEHLPYIPLYRKDKKSIVYYDVKRYNELNANYFIINGFGIERMELLTEKKEHIVDTTLYQPTAEKISEITGEENKYLINLLTQTLVALHHIFSETGSFSKKNLGGERRLRIVKEIIDVFYSTILEINANEMVKKENLISVLEINEKNYEEITGEKIEVDKETFVAELQRIIELRTASLSQAIAEKREKIRGMLERSNHNK